MSNTKESVMTKTFQVSFPKIFTPELNDSGKEVYSLTMLFDSEEDVSNLKALAINTAVGKYGEEVKNNKKFNWPFKRNDDIDLERFPNFKGKIWADAKTQYAPGLVDQNKQEIINQNEFYAGCYARAVVTCYTYDFKGKKGVSFGLTAIQKVRDGEKLGGGVDAATFFDTIETEETVDMDI